MPQSKFLRRLETRRQTATGPHAPRRIALGWLALVFLPGCQGANLFLIYPEVVPAEVVYWTQDIVRDALLIHTEWARPTGEGPFPAVLVHPHGGKTAADMRGVIWDLAGRGYLAMAADYEQLVDGKYNRSFFPWRSEADVSAALDVISGSPLVDADRIGTLGFSQGGIYSLLIAAHAPERVRTVVAYYVVSDFEAWFERDRPNFMRRFVYRVIRWHFRRQSGAQTDEEFSMMLRRASAMHHAERIEAPVLLVHGDADQAAEVDESRRLAARLRELGKTVEYLEVAGGVHIFNFRQPGQGMLAWDVTLDWLQRDLL